MDSFKIICRKNISIITYRVFADGKCFTKYLQIRNIFIKILLYSRMNDQFFHGKTIVNFHQPWKFLCILHPQTSLHRDLHICFAENPVQKLFQFLRSGQKSCSAALCHYCFGWTPKIQIHFLISILFQLIRCT